MNPSALSAWAPRVLSVTRIMSALLFLEHGTQKFFSFPGAYPYPLNGLTIAAGVLELVGGALLALGLFTRPVAFLLSGQMAVGYFLVHAPQSFFPALNGGDAAVLFCFLFLYFVFAGPGPWSVDAARAKGSTV